MTSIAKLKDRARKHEQKEDWRSAIEVYRKVLETEEAEDEIELELGLFNRVGDLYLRLGQIDEAVSYYERAADKYAESGFYNNAIALCNKALRHRPERAEIYLKLSGFCQNQGFLTDARRWILAYAERQVKRGQVEAALTGLRKFVQAANAPDVRQLLAQHLATHDHVDEAIGQLRQAHAEWIRIGDAGAAERVAEQARALDPDVDLAAAAATQDVEDLPGLGEPGDAGPSWERAAPEEGVGATAPAGLEGLETHRFDDTAAPPVGASPPEAETAHEAEAGGVEEVEEDAPTGAGVDVFPGASVVPELDEDQPEPLPLLDTGFDQEGGSRDDPPPLLDRPAQPVADEGSREPEHSIDTPDLVEAADPTEAEPRDTPQWDEGAGAAEQEESESVGSAEVAGPTEPETAEPPVVGSVPSEGEARRAPEWPDQAEETGEPGEAVEGHQAGDTARETGDARGAGEMGEGETAEVGEAKPPSLLEPLDLGAGFEAGGPIGLDVEWQEEGEEEPLVLDLGGPKIESEDAQVDVDVVLNRAKELVSRGLVAEASSELRLLSAADTPPDKLRQALTVTNELVRRNPGDIAVLQRRVEFATRIGDRLLLIDTYTDLADALARSGAETKAQAMYQRVLGLDPQNTTAREALGASAAADEAPVDLEAILREMGGGGPSAEPSPGVAVGDEAFAAMLSQFQARTGDVDAPEDAGAHYDLGLAFKEMGLIDEAIGEFQTALKAGEERLKVYEELGQCFMLNGQYTVAVKILRRALQAPRQSDADLLGVFYQLGQCHEELGQRNEARDAYEKVLAIDAQFEDVIARVARL